MKYKYRYIIFLSIIFICLVGLFYLSSKFMIIFMILSSYIIFYICVRIIIKKFKKKRYDNTLQRFKR